MVVMITDKMPETSARGDPHKEMLRKEANKPIIKLLWSVNVTVAKYKR